MEILKKGYIEENDIKENIIAVLEKVKGSNIINFLFSLIFTIISI